MPKTVNPSLWVIYSDEYVWFLQARFDDGTPSEIHSKINLVDLAGWYGQNNSFLNA